MTVTTDIDIVTDCHAKNHNRDFFFFFFFFFWDLQSENIPEGYERFNNILEMELQHKKTLVNEYSSLASMSPHLPRTSSTQLVMQVGAHLTLAS